MAPSDRKAETFFVVSFCNPCIWLAESKFVSENQSVGLHLWPRRQQYCKLLTYLFSDIIILLTSISHKFSPGDRSWTFKPLTFLFYIKMVHCLKLRRWSDEVFKWNKVVYASSPYCAIKLSTKKHRGIDIWIYRELMIYTYLHWKNKKD